MKIERHRYNLHIRNDVNPLLHKALIDLPGKPGAELIRNLAEQTLRRNQSWETSTSDDSVVSDTGTSEDTNDHFADDLVGLLGKKKKEDKG